MSGTDVIAAVRVAYSEWVDVARDGTGAPVYHVYAIENGDRGRKLFHITDHDLIRATSATAFVRSLESRIKKAIHELPERPLVVTTDAPRATGGRFATSNNAWKARQAKADQARQAKAAREHRLPPDDFVGELSKVLWELDTVLAHYGHFGSIKGLLLSEEVWRHLIMALPNNEHLRTRHDAGGGGFTVLEIDSIPLYPERAFERRR